MNLIPENILRAVCWTLLHSLWQGLVLAVVAGLVMVLSKRAGATLRYNLLCCLMILFVAVSGYTFYRQLHTPVTDSPSITNPLSVAAKRTMEEKAPQTANPETGGGALRDNISSFVEYFNAHASLVVVTWFIIFLARFVKVLSGLIYVQRIRHYQTSPAPADWQQRLIQLLDKLQITSPVSLLESALVKLPVVVGVLKPVILVPVGMLARLSPQQVESILIHELAHILRRDYLFNLVQNLVDTLFFFNPALLWVSSLIRGERENCCDDIAIGETKSRKQFIEALVSFHEYTQSAQGYALSFAGKENQVVRRVKRIVYKKNHSLNAGERVLLMSGLLVFSAAFITINGSSRPTPAIVPGPSVTRSIPSTTTSIPEASSPVRPQKTTIARTGSKPTAQTDPKPAARALLVPPTPPAPGKDTIIKDPPSHKRESSNLYEQLQALGFHNITVDDLENCLRHGVRAEYIEAFQKMGYKDLTLEKAVNLRNHGVSPDFIGGFTMMGYKNITLDQAQELKDHGVTAAFIEEVRQIGFKNISLDKATELVDHGVSTGFIAAWKKKTGSLLELNDYIKLRDSGISPS
jgi:bla regulator protein BlaR1